MQNKSHSPIRYPAIPQTNPLEDAINQAEKKSYILRLRNEKFFDQELIQCDTLDKVIQLTEKRNLGIKIHENGIKFHEAKKLSNIQVYYDDNFQGIQITVELDHKVAAEIISQQNANSYLVRGENEIYSQFEWEEKEKAVLQEQQQQLVQDKKEITKIDDSNESSQINLEKINPSNTTHLYEMAQNAQWRLMIDFQGYTLPGGADPHESCGTWRFSKCREHNYGKRFIHSCNRLSCPTCVKRTGQKIAKKLERRIWLYRLMMQKTTSKRQNPKPSHIVESIPADDIFWSYSKSKQQRILKEMRKIAGITGGVSVTHYWRFESGKLNPYVSIHNHLIAFGWVSPTAKSDIYQKFGINCVYHKVENGTLHKRENVFSVAYYLLSHCAIKNNKHSVHWFGELSYRKIKNSYLKQFRDEQYITEDADIVQSKSCDLCGELLVPARINKDFHNWQRFLPDDDEMSDGCMFPEGLLLELDFLSEKMEFYDSQYNTIHHKTKREINEQNVQRRPKLYSKEIIQQRKNSNQSIESFLVCEKTAKIRRELPK